MTQSWAGGDWAGKPDQENSGEKKDGVSGLASQMQMQKSGKSTDEVNEPWGTTKININGFIQVIRAA